MSWKRGIFLILIAGMVLAVSALLGSCLVVLLGFDHAFGAFLGSICLGAGALIAVFAWELITASSNNALVCYRIDHGLCRGCGYDIRASTDRCPECGQPFKPYEKAKLCREETDKG